jgi:hypothetical protein
MKNLANGTRGVVPAWQQSTKDAAISKWQLANSKPENQKGTQ